jgi:hypothetical protein
MGAPVTPAEVERRRKRSAERAAKAKVAAYRARSRAKEPAIEAVWNCRYTNHAFGHSAAERNHRARYAALIRWTK